MRNFIISIIIFLLWAFLGMWWYYSCPMCANEMAEKTNTVKEAVVVPIEETTINTYNGFNIANAIGADAFNFQDEMQIFNHKDSTGIVHFPERTMRFKDSVFAYLNRNQNKVLHITGWYKNGEWRNNDEAQNFGLDRAGYIKNMLTKFGINGDRISLSANKEGYNYANGHYNGGVNMQFKDIEAARAATIDEGITNKILYTRFNARNFKPDNTLQGYASELKNYLAKHPNKTVTITGHTDSVGDAANNEVLARDRATNVMNYFAQRGVDKAKMKRFSKGETIPAATNATQEGRAKNRRIEIKVN